MKLEQVAEFKSCLTCVYRKLHPPAMQTGRPEFYYFGCRRSCDSAKDMVKPGDVCDCWRGVTLDGE